MITVFVVIVVVALGVTSWYIYYSYKKREKINRILTLLKDEKVSILKDEPVDRNGKINLELKLVRAAMTRGDFYVTMGLIYLIFAFFIGAGYFYLEMIHAIALTVGLVVLGIFMPNIYLDSVHKERIKKIDHDLSTFLDLVIIILESGGGMKNALKDVSRRGEKILDPELIKEIKMLETEMTTYSAEEAYNNLVRRTGSKYVTALVDFLKLADDTGIGVKSIFESQSKDIKDEEFFEVEKKAATVNLTLTLIIFLFIVPSLGAFIVLPMMNDNMLAGLDMKAAKK